jgi:hypothetical protein
VAFDTEAAIAKLAYLRGVFSRRGDQFRERDLIYEMQHEDAFWAEQHKKPGDDLRDRILMTSLPVKAVNTIVGMFTQNPLRFVVQPDSRRPTQVQLERTGQVEAFLGGVWQENEARYRNIRSRHVKSGSVRGWGTYRVIWNPDRETDAEDDGARCGTPIELEPVDSSCLFAESGGVVEDWQSVMYATLRRRVEVEREWGVHLTEPGENGTAVRGPHDDSLDSVTVVDYWWWQRGPFKYHGKKRTGWHLWQAVFTTDGDVLKKATAMPGYSRIPYIPWLTQVGYRSEPEFWGQGHLEAAKHAIANADRGISRWYRMLTYSAEGGGWLQQVKDDAEDWSGDSAVMMEPGVWRSLPRGWNAVPASQNFAHQLAQALVELFLREAQEILLPQIATGHLPAGGSDMAGVTLQGIIDQAATFLAPDVESYATCISHVCTLMLDLCAYYSPDSALVVKHTRGRGKRLQATHVSLKGTDLAGFSVDVAVDTENQADKMRKAQLGLQFSRAPEGQKVLSLRTIREDLCDVEDPDREDYLIDLEEVWHSEQMKAYRLALAAEHLGMPRPAPEAAAPVATPNAGAVPPGVQPPTPAGLPPGMLPGQMGMQPSGPMVGGMMPGPAPMGPMGGPPPGMVSPQELGGSPMGMPVLPGMVPPGVIPR